MATVTDEQDRLLEQARQLAVGLEAELALVGGLVLAADESGLLVHSGTAHSTHVRAHRDCPTCQLRAWAKAIA